MGTISVWLPAELEAELEAYAEEEHLDRGAAMVRLLAGGLEGWHRERALDQMRGGEVTFSRAAEFADMTVWDFVRLVREEDVTWVAEDNLDADVEAL